MFIEKDKKLCVFMQYYFYVYIYEDIFVEANISFIHIDTHTHPQTNIRGCVRVGVVVRVCMCAVHPGNSWRGEYICLCILIYTYTYTYTYMHVYVCRYICMCIYTRTFAAR